MPLKEKSKEKKVQKKKSDRRIKRKSSERIKKTWEKFVQQNDSRSLLKDIWKGDNNQKEYLEKINKFHKKYSCS